MVLTETVPSSFLQIRETHTHTHTERERETSPIIQCNCFGITEIPIQIFVADQLAFCVFFFFSSFLHKKRERKPERDRNVHWIEADRHTCTILNTSFSCCLFFISSLLCIMIAVLIIIIRTRTDRAHRSVESRARANVFFFFRFVYSVSLSDPHRSLHIIIIKWMCCSFNALRSAVY